MKPTNKNLFLLLMSLALVLGTTFIACEGPTGPQGEQGLQGEQGPQGPDGNANVTRYVLDGFDFSDSNSTLRTLDDISETELDESFWLVYLVHSNGWKYNVPGCGVLCQSTYGAGQAYGQISEGADFWISLDTGGGESYEEIHIVQIEESNVVGGLKAGLRASPESLIPDDLDVSDYDAVAEYYGLTEEDIVRL